MKPPRETGHPSETALSTACQARIRKEWGGAVTKIHGTAAQRSGTPDLLGCLRGRMFAIELKQPSKRPTAIQWKRLREFAAAGALAGYVTTEAELDELLAHVDDYEWVNPQLAR